MADTELREDGANQKMDEIFKDPCFHTQQPSNYPLLPLITVNYPNKSLNLGRSCEVCCLKDDTANVDFYQTDPTLTDEIKLYRFGEEEAPIPFTIISEYPLIRRAHFKLRDYPQGDYEIRTINRYGSTSVKFKVLYDSSEAAGCTSPLGCKFKRPGRQIVS
ncbi:uncharacterized protein LOC134268692 [Saccostrea cucullata]|uniref:uncharacterized protein LOC134268692 n=1 Tax=Saccostrea cuccullata TaxID=36930 RepID=UPI002ED6A0ED